MHGDLHPANILVHAGRISGVIDFGDLTSGDPATDLSVAWMLLPASERDVFREAYGQADDHTWARARGWALSLSLVFMAFSADNPLMAGIGQRTLREVLMEEADTIRLAGQGAPGPREAPAPAGCRNRGDHSDCGG